MTDPIVLTETAPLRFLGVETGARMTVVRLRQGLFVHSPLELTPDREARVRALGEVVAIVAPSKFHHLYAGAWAKTWPEAVLCGCPSVVAKRSDLPWTHTLGDEPLPLWRDEVEQVYFAARTLEDEVVFHVPASRALVCADALFNLSNHPDPVTRVAAFFLGNHAPGATLLERLLIRDRAGARRQVDRMLAWNADRIVLAHGPPIDTGGHEVLRAAFRWL